MGRPNIIIFFSPNSANNHFLFLLSKSTGKFKSWFIIDVSLSFALTSSLSPISTKKKKWGVGWGEKESLGCYSSGLGANGNVGREGDTNSLQIHVLEFQKDT